MNMTFPATFQIDQQIIKIMMNIMIMDKKLPHIQLP